MTFLNQHFITDAGVPLPKNSDISQPNNNEPVSQTDIIPLISNTENCEENFNIESTISNLSITDDVKVNMRKISSKKTNITKRYSSEIPKIVTDNFRNNKKRYSSILSENEISTKNYNKDTLSNKRHSLVVTSKEMSKIPVSFKSADTSDDRNKNSNIKKGSSLPVPIR